MDDSFAEPSAPQLSEVLRKVSVPIWRNKECQEVFAKAKFNFTVHETQMCAGSYGKDSCDVILVSYNDSQITNFLFSSNYSFLII